MSNQVYTSHFCMKYASFSGGCPYSVCYDVSPLEPTTGTLVTPVKGNVHANFSF